MITYNHGKFVRQALQGIFIQTINFPSEVIIADDFSTDNTREIIMEFMALYPNKIKLIFQKRNVGAKNNWLDLLKAAKGKYIAYFEGDDYWTDPLKLQKQVDFLEKNKDYVITYHDARVVDDNNIEISKSKINSESQRQDKTSLQLIQLDAEILTLTVCFRNCIKEFPWIIHKSFNGDAILFSLLGNYGKGKFMTNILPASFRYHNHGVWSGRNIAEKLYNSRQTYALLEKYYSDLQNIEVANHFNYAKNGMNEKLFYYSIEDRKTKLVWKCFFYTLTNQSSPFTFSKFLILSKTLIKYHIKLLRSIHFESM